MTLTPPLIIAGVILALVIWTIARAVRIVPQANSGIVERLGRYQRTLGPGLHFLVPFLDKLRRPLVDMREQTVGFPSQPVITKDNVTVNIDTVFYYRINNPTDATYEVADLLNAVEQLTLTTLRNAVGELSLDEALTSRDNINTRLRQVLDEATSRWGIKVERVEIKAIDPPASVQGSMEAQMRAEREKRATVLTAEGEKESAILRAQGQKEAQILSAQGDRESQVLRAQGEAEGIERLRAALEANPDMVEYYLRFQYISQLPAFADGRSNTVFMPMPAMEGLGAMSALGAALETGRGVSAPKVGTADEPARVARPGTDARAGGFMPPPPSLDGIR